MGRMYTLSLDAGAITTAIDLFQIETLTEQPVIIHSVEFGQTTDYGDTAAEGLRILFRNRITAAVTNSVPEVAIDVGDAAFGGNTNANATVITTGNVIVHASAWNIQIPFLWVPPPNGQHLVRGTDAFTVHLADAPTDSITISGTVVFEEMG